MKKKVDFLVIGTGLAGLSFALKVAEHGKVCVVSKTNIEETNTQYAQGGIAAVTYEPDTYEKHISDTLVAGDGLCDEEVVRQVVGDAPEQIEELMLDAMMAALKKIKDRNLFYSNVATRPHNDPYPF